MLRDWIGRGTGRTLFVLRNALHSSDRPECVEYLDQEINGIWNISLLQFIGSNIQKESGSYYSYWGF